MLGFAGVIMVLRPDAGALSPWAAVPVLAGVLYAMGGLATRTWCAGESTLSLLLGVFAAMGTYGALGLLALAMLGPEVPPGTDGFIMRGWVFPGGPFLFWTAVQAVGSVLALWFLIRGYQLGDASFSAVFEYSLLLIVSVWAFVLRGEVLDPWAMAGIALITISGAAIALRGRES